VITVSLYDYGDTLLAVIPLDDTDFPLVAQIRLGELGNINEGDTDVTTAADFRNVHVGHGAWGANDLFDDDFTHNAGTITAPFSPWSGYEEEQHSPDALTVASIASAVLDVSSTVVAGYTANFTWASLEKDDLSVPKPSVDSDIYFTWDVNDGGGDSFAGQPLALGDQLIRGFNLHRNGGGYVFDGSGPGGWPPEVDMPLYDGSVSDWTTWGYRLHVEGIRTDGLHVWHRS
jgi:hypothetical protein